MSLQWGVAFKGGGADTQFLYLQCYAVHVFGHYDLDVRLVHGRGFDTAGEGN